MAMMEPLDIDVELVAQTLEPQRFGAPGVLVDLAPCLPRFLELCQHVELSGFTGVQFQAKLPQTDFAQAPIHHVEGCDLFGDEEHAPALGQALRDQVRDGLALAGARWPDQHEVFATHGRHYGAKLRRVGRQGAKALLGSEFDIEPLRAWKRHASGVALARCIDEVSNHRVLAQLIGAFAQVLPHQVLGEREHRQYHVLAHLPALDVLNSVGNRFPDGGDVEAGFVLGQLAFGDAEVELEVLAQHLDQRRIETRLVVVQAEGEAGPRALAVQRDRHQHEGCPASPGLIVARPGQKTHRQIERIGAALLQRRACRAVQLDQPDLQVFLRHGDEHLASLQSVERMLAPQVFALALFVDRSIARVGTVHQFWPRQQPQRLPSRQQVFKRARVGCLQHERLFAVLEVEQVVAQRQVQQLALPACEPVLRVERGRIRLGDRRLVGQVGGRVEWRFYCRGWLGGSGERWGLCAGQRLDALHARTPDVDGQFEGFFLLL